jgi:hypothetical protein
MTRAEAHNVSSELTVAIRISGMNNENSDQWTRTLICALRSVSVRDFFVERDKLWLLCPPALVS